MRTLEVDSLVPPASFDDLAPLQLAEVGGRRRSHKPVAYSRVSRLLFAAGLEPCIRSVGYVRNIEQSIFRRLKNDPEVQRLLHELKDTRQMA